MDEDVADTIRAMRAELIEEAGEKWDPSTTTGATAIGILTRIANRLEKLAKEVDTSG